MFWYEFPPPRPQNCMNSQFGVEFCFIHFQDKGSNLQNTPEMCCQTFSHGRNFSPFGLYRHGCDPPKRPIPDSLLPPNPVRDLFFRDPLSSFLNFLSVFQQHNYIEPFPESSRLTVATQSISLLKPPKRSSEVEEKT